MKDYNKSLNYSFLLLKYRPRSLLELKNRLKQKGYSLLIIDKVLAYLSENNYLNDTEFTRLFVSSCVAKGWGQRRIDLALKHLGISEDLRKCSTSDKEIYRNKLREILERKINRYKGQKNAYQKIVRYLASKGFDYEDIFKELDESSLK